MRRRRLQTRLTDTVDVLCRSPEDRRAFFLGEIPEHFRSRVEGRSIIQQERRAGAQTAQQPVPRSEEHTSELQSLMRISYAVFCLTKKKKQQHTNTSNTNTRTKQT